MALTDIILRTVSHPPLTTKGSILTWAEEDNNFIIIFDALAALAAVGSSSFSAYNAGTNYNPATSPNGIYVTYAGNVWKFVSGTANTGTTPGTNPAVWVITSIGEFAHQQNTDQALDLGGTNEIYASAIIDLFSQMTDGYLPRWDDGNKQYKDSFLQYLTTAPSGSDPVKWLLLDPDTAFRRATSTDWRQWTEESVTPSEGINWKNEHFDPSTPGDFTRLQQNWAGLSYQRFVGGSSVETFSMIEGIGTTFENTLGMLCKAPGGVFSWMFSGPFASYVLDGSGYVFNDESTGTVKAIYGEGIRLNESIANPTSGVVNLVAGTKTVPCTLITAGSRIHLTINALGTVTAPKAIAVTAKAAGTSFTITSEDNTDTSQIYWTLFETI